MSDHPMLKARGKWTCGLDYGTCQAARVNFWQGLVAGWVLGFCLAWLAR